MSRLRFAERGTRIVRTRGMTLLELLLVMGIAVLLLGSIGSAFNSFTSSVEVSNSVSQLGAALDFARQVAVSRNEYVQVRLYSPSGGNTRDARAGEFVALGIYRCQSPLYGAASDYDTWSREGRFSQEGRLFDLAASCIIVNSPTFSPLLEAVKSDAAVARTGVVTLPSGGTYDFLDFYFKPDGSLDISITDPAGLTVCQFNRFAVDKTKLPPNYAIVTVDPLNGRFQIVRP